MPARSHPLRNMASGIPCLATPTHTRTHEHCHHHRHTHALTSPAPLHSCNFDSAPLSPTPPHTSACLQGHTRAAIWLAVSRASPHSGTLADCHCCCCESSTLLSFLQPSVDLCVKMLFCLSCLFTSLERIPATRFSYVTCFHARTPQRLSVPNRIWLQGGTYVARTDVSS